MSAAMNGRGKPDIGKTGAGKAGAGEGATSPNASRVNRAQRKAARPQPKPKPIKAQARVRRLDSGVVQTITGRPAQTLLFLIACGRHGATSGDFSTMRWGRRTSAYVFDLRAMGFEIETRHEQIGDALVGRYILHTALEVVPVGEGKSC
jgi:hypothetical protein